MCLGGGCVGRERVRRLELTVTADNVGARVDTLLHKHLQLSGTVIRRMKWLEDGILVDGVRVNTRFVPRLGRRPCPAPGLPENKNHSSRICCGRTGCGYKCPVFLPVSKPLPTLP